jgi:hypothetical protein
MDLNKYIKEQELIVEEINNELDNLLNENIGLVFKVLGKVAGAIPKKTYKKALDALKDEVFSTEKEIEKIEKEGPKTSDTSKDEKLKQIEELLLKLEELQNLTQSLEDKKQKTLKYKKVVIDFKKKVSLDIKEMKSPDFQRNLLGTMYFKVIDIDEEEKFILLKTNSFPDTTFIKLEYKVLETYSDQKGDVNLIYSRYKNPNLRPVEGEEEECYFKFVELT